MIGPLITGWFIGMALGALLIGQHSDKALVYAVIAVAVAVFHVGTRLPR